MTWRLRLALLATTTLCAPSLSFAAPCATSGTPDFAASAGGFGVLDGTIYSPDGQPFVARGINIGPDDMGSATPDALQAAFPGINFVRFATRYDYPGVSVEQQEAYINALTARGIVVEVEDHAYPSPPPYTGAQLAAEFGLVRQDRRRHEDQPVCVVRHHE